MAVVVDQVEPSPVVVGHCQQTEGCTALRRDEWASVQEEAGFASGKVM